MAQKKKWKKFNVKKTDDHLWKTLKIFEKNLIML